MRRYRLFFSYYVVVVVLLAITTFLSPEVYSRWWFTAMWFGIGLMLLIAVIARRLWRNVPSFMLHGSFLVILAGGFITSMCSQKGMIELHPGHPVAEARTTEGTTFPLPFSLELDSFVIDYYPGGEAPRDFTSFVKIDNRQHRISMNNIADISGYRLYQASYDGRGGSIISVNHDPWGTAVTYTGYALFALVGLLLLVNPKGRFRMLLKGTALCACLSVPSAASASAVAGIPLSQADSLRVRQVMYNGKIVTFNTLSRDFLKKVHGGTSYRGLSPEQVVASWTLFPEEWRTQPIIKVKEKWLRDSLEATGKYLSLTDLFDSEGRYRIAALYRSVPPEKIRALEELDEKAGLILTLLNGDFIRPVPQDAEPLSSRQVEAELLYNSVPWTAIVFILLFVGATAGLTLCSITGRANWLPWLMLAAALAVHLFLYALEWFITSHLPLASTFETLQFMAIVTMLLSAAIGKRNRMMLYMGMLLSGAIALVAHINNSNPVLTPLMPVLASPWLSIHVTLVMTAYALLAFTFVNSLLSAFRLVAAQESQRMSLTILYPAVWILGLGIFTGAVWANVSWGRYWAWDPKETWALITMMVYAVPLHRNISLTGTPRRFNMYVLFAFATIIMTYFGVNYLPSLHSYGG